MLGPLSSFKAVALEIGVVAHYNVTPDVIGPLSVSSSCPGDWVLPIMSQQCDFGDWHSLATDGCANKFVFCLQSLTLTCFSGPFGH